MHTKTLIALATAWGPKHGGINSFNRDLIRAFGNAFRETVRVICLIPRQDETAIKDALSASVELRHMDNPPEGERLTASHAAEIVASLKDVITTETFWLGHDNFTGAAAVAAAKQTNTKSAVIHHMSYAAYKAFQSGSSGKAAEKSREQHDIFSQADYRLAVGPLLRDELEGLVDSDDVKMLIPGLPEIDTKAPPKRWTVLLFGRLDPESDRIKQGRLGVAAFATCYRDALNQAVLSPALRDRPRMKLYGIEPTEEAELREFANAQAGAALDFQALPFLEDRKALFDELGKASVALMPSWHEGFGLTGWEAIGAGVPLILSRQSGLYKFLQEEMAGAGTAYAVDIRGREADEPYQEQDVTNLANAIKQVAADSVSARRTALKLREMLSDRTWTKCAEDLAAYIGWPRANPPALELPAPIAVQTHPPLDGLIHLPQPLWQAGTGHSDSVLLRAEEACVPFHHGRDQVLGTLIDWAEGMENYPLALRLYTAPGGTGKTRMLIEACRRLGEGWQAGFLVSDISPNDIKRRLPTWLRQHPMTLMVVDYAETRSDQLVALVEAAQGHSNCRLRIVLLARAAGDWWDRLPNRSTLCEAIFSGYATSGPYPLPPLHSEVADRAAAFRSAWVAFADKLQIQTPPPPLPDLFAEHFASPLYLQMATLMALRGEHADTARGLLDAVLRHESHYWRRLGETMNLADSDRHALPLLALSTLAGGITTPREAWALYQIGGGPALAKADLEKLFLALCPLYPGRQGLQPVSPDLLGESLVARALNLAADQGEGLLAALLGSRASEAVRRHTLTVLTRLAQHRPDMGGHLADALTRHFPSLVSAIVGAGLETGEPLPSAAIAALDRLGAQEHRQVVGLLHHALPQETVKLAGLALTVAEYRAGIAQLAYQRKKSAEQTRQYLKALNNLGIRQTAMARLEEAQQSYEAGVQLSERLSGGDQEVVAMLFNNLGKCLRELGRPEEAIRCAQRDLAITERLATAHPKHHDHELAISLSNMGNHLRDLGQHEEALQYAQRAMTILERRALAHPGSYEPDLTIFLGNLGNHLSGVGRYEEALQLAQRALAILERLAAAHSDRFDPALAQSLGNLGAHLSDLGRYEEALQLAQRALAIRERLAAAHPDRFDPDLATSFNNLGSHLSDLGRHEEALQYAHRALAILDRLAAAHPDRFDPDLAMSLSNLGGHLGDLGNYQEALRRRNAALVIYRRLAMRYPDRYSDSLADELHAQALLTWIGTSSEIDLPQQQEVDALQAHVQPHLRPVFLAFRASVLGCFAHEHDPASSLASMHEAESLYDALPHPQRRQLQETHMIATSYLAQYDPTPERQRIAQEAYQAFSAPRHGRLPRRMLDILDRLGCKPV